MGTHELLSAAITGALVVGTVAVYWRRRTRREGWTQAVAHVAAVFGLRVFAAGSGSDSARGNVGRCQVKLDVDSKSYSHANDSYERIFRVVEVGGIALPNGLFIHRRGTPTGGIEPPPPPAKPTGDAAFDAELEVLGASDAMARALLEPPVRALVQDAVGALGAKAWRGTVTLERREWNTSPAELEDVVRRLLAFAESLADLPR